MRWRRAAWRRRASAAAVAQTKDKGGYGRCLQTRAAIQFACSGGFKYEIRRLLAYHTPQRDAARLRPVACGDDSRCLPPASEPPLALFTRQRRRADRPGESRPAAAAMSSSRRDCLQKMKYGAIMGGGVGSAAGFLFGSYEAFRYKGIPASQVRAARLRGATARAKGGASALGLFAC